MWIELWKAGLTFALGLASGVILTVLKTRSERKAQLEAEDRQRAERVETEERERIERAAADRRQVLRDLHSAISTLRSLPACPQGAAGPEIAEWFRDRAEVCGKIWELALLIEDEELSWRVRRLWFLGEPLDLDMMAVLELRDGIFEEDLRRDMAKFALDSVSSALLDSELPPYEVKADTVMAFAELFAVCVVRQSRMPAEVPRFV